MRPRGGWQDGRAYPLLYSRVVDMALVKFRADKGISLGKAINRALEEGLIQLGYLKPEPSGRDEQVAAEQKELDFAKRNWGQMPSNSREYWLKRFPELVVEESRK